MSELFYLQGANGQLSLYDDRLIITRKGFLPLISHLKCKETELEYSEIETFTFRKGWFVISGYFHFRTKDSRDCNLIEAATDPNGIVFRSYENKNARIINSFLRTKMKGV